MIRLKSPAEIEVLKEGGAILAWTLKEVKSFALENYKSGNLTAADLDAKAEELLNSKGVFSAFKNYPGSRESGPFPASLCVSINDEVVHGIPGDRVLREGDIIGIDLGVVHKEMVTDSAISFILGEPNDREKRLIHITEEALFRGIMKAVIGNKTGDIGSAIEEHVVGSGFDVVRDYCGHGVGYSVHEDPSIPNHGPSGVGDVLKEGMVIAIEPMVTSGKGDVFVDSNGWTVKTKDGGKSAHFEHSVAITKNGPVILTRG